MALQEKMLRALFREQKRFPPGSAWLIEPGLGSDTGLPDVMVPAMGHLHPVELKCGPKPESMLEPSQRKFHRLSLLRGVQTFCLSFTDTETIVGYVFEIDSENNIVALPYVRFSWATFSSEFLRDWISSVLVRNKKHRRM